MSSHNPFRTNPPTSNSTGASASSAGLPISSDTLPHTAEPQTDIPSSSGLTFTSPSTSSSGTGDTMNLVSSASPSSPPEPPRNPGRVMEEEPPAYTPAPDVYQGESTLECGPQRPFQPPPAPPPSWPPQQTSYNHGGWSHVQHQVYAQRPSPSPGETLRSAWQEITGQLSNIASAATNPGSSYNQYHAGPHPQGSYRNGGWSGYPGQQHHPPPPPRPPQGPPMIALSRSQGPPPGAVVYAPGDPRLGGRLCWRCNGKGTVNFMLFDQEQCSICGGIGRIFG